MTEKKQSPRSIITCFVFAVEVELSSPWLATVGTSSKVTWQQNNMVMVACSRISFSGDGKRAVDEWGMARTHDLCDTGHGSGSWSYGSWVRSWVRIPFRPEFLSGFNFTTAQVVCVTAMMNHKIISFSAVQIYDLSYIHLQNCFHLASTFFVSVEGASSRSS